MAVPLLYGKNSSISTHGGYSLIDTTPQTGITTAFYPWAEIAGSITISRLEERQNSGEGQLINLLESKIKQAEMSMREKLNSDLLLGTVSATTFLPDTADNGNYGLFPLGFFLRKLNATDPTAPTTVGGISSADNSWWRHYTGWVNNQNVSGNSFYASITTWAGLKQYLYRMYNYCSRGSGGSPNLIVMDQVTFESYNAALDAKMQYTDTKLADMGFDNIKMRGATCVWDEVVPDVYTGTAAVTVGSAFFLNTQFYSVIVDSETNIVTTPFLESDVQTAKTAKILFQGQATISNMRKFGVVGGVLQSMTS